MSKEDEYTPQLGGFRVRTAEHTAKAAEHDRNAQAEREEFKAYLGHEVRWRAQSINNAAKHHERINELKPKADKLDSLNSAQRTGAMKTNKANYDDNRQLLEPYWHIYRKAIDEGRPRKRFSDVKAALEADGRHVPARNTIEHHMELIDQEKP